MESSDNVSGLTLLQPYGLWRGPLSNERIGFASAFGEKAAKTGPSVDEAFRVPIDEKLGAVITVATAFERIAKYAELQTRAGQFINEEQMAAFARDPIFETHYALDLVSPHKKISVMRFKEVFDDEHRVVGRNDFEQMLPLYQTEVSKGIYRQVVAFRNMDGFRDNFEAVVFRFPFITKVSVVFEVELYHYH